MKEIRFSFDNDDMESDIQENDDFNSEEEIFYDDTEEEEAEDETAEEPESETESGPYEDVYTGEETEDSGEKPHKHKNIKKNKARKKSGKDFLKKALLGIIIFAAAGAVVLASPVFSVRNIEINELNYFTKEEICSEIGLSQGDNGVFFNKGKAEKKLEGNKYIYSADISFRFPDTMVITIDENRIYGYIPYLGSYLYIDREGRVIDIKSETDEKLPVIEGLKFGYFTQGEIIPVENSEAFDAALIISKAMLKYDMLDKKISINVADSDNIYAYIDNIKVLLGDTARMEEKIKTMSEAVAEIPDGDRGTLDLRDLSKPIIFKYTT